MTCGFWPNCRKFPGWKKILPVVTHRSKEFLPVLKSAKRMGFADSHIARLVNMKAVEVRDITQAGRHHPDVPAGGYLRRRI